MDDNDNHKTYPNHLVVVHDNVLIPAVDLTLFMV